MQILGNIVCSRVPARCTLYEVYLSRINDSKMKYQDVKDRCTVRWSVVVQCRYWATLYVLEYLIGAHYMMCTCPGLTIGKMKYQDVKDRCTVRWSVIVQCRYWATLYVL